MGSFKADVVCRDSTYNSCVLIENQLKRTDHSHLGQLLAYAAGLDAATIVWIAREFTEEHRSALDWLNMHSSEDVRFFGLVIELWRIADSVPAPRFQIIAKPNDWSKSLNEIRRGSSTPLTDTQAEHLRFWTGFRDYLEGENTKLGRVVPSHRHECRFAIGGGRSVYSTVTRRDDRVCVKLYFPSAGKSLYRALESNREAIRTRLGFDPEWDEKESGTSEIATYLAADGASHLEWPRHYEWAKDRLEAFHSVFHPELKKIGLRVAET